VVRVFEDSGISGAKGRDARPGLDALMKGVSRRDFDMVLAWSVDCLGRSLTGLLELLTELHAKHVDLYLHQQGVRAIHDPGAVLAGMSRAAASGTRSGKPIGRPRLAPETEASIRTALQKGDMGLRKVTVQFEWRPGRFSALPGRWTWALSSHHPVDCRASAGRSAGTI
jgi:DNA invertase Pin-like site-specific DNA recombinase